ncbi:MAG TPA: calcium-binding protein [Rhizomicrobium sp.]
MNDVMGAPRIGAVALLHARDLLHDDTGIPNAGGWISPLDSFTGTTGNDTETGTASNDTFAMGQGGNDTVNGEGGDDTIGMGNTLAAGDKLDGGTGNDTVNISGNYNLAFTAKMMVNVETLGLAPGFDYTLKSNDATVAAGQTLTVNGFALGTAGSLNFDGSAETDGKFVLDGGAGNDVLVGGAGVDTFNLSDGGTDTVSGGAGDDTTVFSAGNFNPADHVDGGADNHASAGTPGDVVVFFGQGPTIAPGDHTFANVELVYFNPGASYTYVHADGNALPNQQLSLYAADLAATNTVSLDITAETDDFVSLMGGAGNDTLKVGGVGSANGGMGNDTMTATGTVFDYVSYFDWKGTESGVTVDLSITTAQNTIGAGTDTITGFLNLAGTAYNDHLTGDSRNNAIFGGGGNDTIHGADGDDIIAIGLGKSIVDGGNGNDLLSLFGSVNGGSASSFTTGVTASLAVTGAQNVGPATVTIINVEALQGTAFADVLTGDTNDNTLYGAGGNDKLTGGNGNDTLWGDAGYFFSTEGNISSAANPYGFLDLPNGGNDTLNGGAGDDTLNPGTGTDVVLGGPGNDFVNMGAALTAADKIDGGTEQDTVNLAGDYSGGITFTATTMVKVETLNLAAKFNYAITTDDATVAAGQTLTVVAALTSANTLTFDGSAEKDGTFNIQSGAGDDILTGGKGNDILSGGLGADLLTGGGGSDTFVYGAAKESTGPTFDTLEGFNAAQDKIDLTTVVKKIDTAVTHGALSDATFNQNLAAALGASVLGKGHAILFTPDSGGEAGHTFLVVDMNGTAGYQANQDLVIMLSDGVNLASLSTATFV